MVQPADEAKRLQLGLGNVVLGDEEVVLVPADTTGQGKGQALIGSALSILGVNGHFWPATLQSAERVGFSVSVCAERRSVVRIVSESGGPLSPRGTATTGDWCCNDATDPGTVFVDVAATELVALTQPDGSGLILELRPGGIAVTAFQPPGIQIPPLADVQAPLNQWLTASPDPWLASQANRRLGTDDPWEHVVAAGLVMRLAAPPPGPAARRHVERLLAGEADEARLLPRLWAKGLTADQIETVQDLLLAVLDRVAAEVDTLHETMSPSEAPWRSSLLAACTERDDVECARLLLWEADAADRVMEAIEAVDTLGDRLIASLPVRVTLQDERLWRSKLADPTAWWAALAAPGLAA